MRPVVEVNPILALIIAFVVFAAVAVGALIAFPFYCGAWIFEGPAGKRVAGAVGLGLWLLLILSVWLG